MCVCVFVCVCLCVCVCVCVCVCACVCVSHTGRKRQRSSSELPGLETNSTACRAVTVESGETVSELIFTGACKPICS